MNLAIDVATLASINFLLGLGIVTVYKGTRILNFALPGVILATAYLTVTVASHAPLVVALAAGALTAAGLGALTFYVGILPILGRPTYVGILTTVSIGFMLESIVTIIWKVEIRNLNLPSTSFTLGDRLVSSDQAIMWMAALGAGILFGIVYRYTRVGLWLAATADKNLLARQRGIPVMRVLLASFVIAALLGYVVALLLGARQGITMALGSAALRGLVVALVGGLDSVLGAALAAVLLGIVEAWVVQTDPRLATVVPYMVLLAVLVWRPWGLLGTPEELERV